MTTRQASVDVSESADVAPLPMVNVKSRPAPRCQSGLHRRRQPRVQRRRRRYHRRSLEFEARWTQFGQACSRIDHVADAHRSRLLIVAEEDLETAAAGARPAGDGAVRPVPRTQALPGRRRELLRVSCLGRCTASCQSACIAIAACAGATFAFVGRLRLCGRRPVRGSRAASPGQAAAGTATCNS